MESTKRGYEPIPDVEKGGDDKAEALAPKAKYPDLDEEQADLLLSFDEAIAESSLKLDIPSVSPNDLLSAGQDFLRSLVAPTATAVSMLLVALYLKATAEVSSISDALVKLFPYVNASIVFFSSLNPIQDRFMVAVAPVFEKTHEVKEQVSQSMTELASSVDATIESLQAKVNNVMRPMKPTLQKAHGCATALKAMDPDIEIPDPDIDKEFDGMQGILQGKVADAKQHMELNMCIPIYLQTAQAFYWSIVFPVVFVALAIQLALAWVTTYYGGTPIGSTRALVEIDELVTVASEGRGLLLNVCTSYAMAWVQMGLVYLYTNPRARVWLLSLLVESMKDEATRQLRAYGVSDALEDIMGARMAQRREKVLKAIRSFKKIEELLSKIGGTSLVVATEAASLIAPQPQGKVSPKRPGLLGKLMGHHNNKAKKGH